MKRKIIWTKPPFLGSTLISQGLRLLIIFPTLTMAQMCHQDIDEYFAPHPQGDRCSSRRSRCLEGHRVDMPQRCRNPLEISRQSLPLRISWRRNGTIFCWIFFEYAAFDWSHSLKRFFFLHNEYTKKQEVIASYNVASISIAKKHHVFILNTESLSNRLPLAGICCFSLRSHALGLPVFLIMSELKKSCQSWCSILRHPTRNDPTWSFGKPVKTKWPARLHLYTPED